MDYKTTKEDVEDLLRGCDVLEFQHIMDRETGRSKGFGYIEFGDRYGKIMALALLELGVCKFNHSKQTLQCSVFHC